MRIQHIKTELADTLVPITDGQWVEMKKIGLMETVEKNGNPVRGNIYKLQRSNTYVIDDGDNFFRINEDVLDGYYLLTNNGKVMDYHAHNVMSIKEREEKVSIDWVDIEVGQLIKVKQRNYAHTLDATVMLVDATNLVLQLPTEHERINNIYLFSFAMYSGNKSAKSECKNLTIENDIEVT